MNFLLKKNISLNEKYNSYFDLTNFKCIDDKNIISLESKINSFCIDDDYDYAYNLTENINILPKININLTKISEYFEKYKSIDELEIMQDLKIINYYVKKLLEFVNVDKIENLREENIIFYLFQFLNKSFFYIFLNPYFNFITNSDINSTKKERVSKYKEIKNDVFENYFNFFSNYIVIKNSAKLYLSNDIYNSQVKELDNDQKKQLIKKLRTKTNLALFLAFEELQNYPKEFKIFINNCQNILCLIVYNTDNNRDIDEKEENENIIYYKKMNLLLEYFIKSLDIFHSINEIYNLIDYKNFYNFELNHNFDIEKEFMFYKKNQTKIDEMKTKDLIKQNDEDFNIYNYKIDLHNLSFTLLTYTWLFDAGVKFKLINLYNNHSQDYTILDSFSNLFPQIRELLNGNNNLLNENNEINLNLCLTLSIRRDNLIEDTLKELAKANLNFRSPLKIEFIGEEGIDQGGLKKEYFMLLTRQIFNEKNSLFSYHSKSRLFWFNIYSKEKEIKYELIGKILGLSIYNGIILDIKFPLALYKKLLRVEPCLEDIKEIDEELYNNFCYLLKMNDENLESEIDSNFTTLIEKDGEKIIIPLIENGENIMINNENKKKFIDLYVDWFFNKSISNFYLNFEKGFYKVFDKDLSKILTPEELELIICGSSYLDFHELQKVCIYKDGYNKDSLTIKYFWEIVFDFDEEEKKKLLSFITGCDRAPINGLGNLIISITRIGADVNKLPSAYTCFNDLLLPDYKDKDLLKKCLIIGINYSEGFGLN